GGVGGGGEEHELTVEATPLATLAARFHAAHERRYGFADRDAALEVVTLEVGGWLPANLPRERAPVRRPRRPVPTARARAWLGSRSASVPVLRREQLAPGASLAGPAAAPGAGA